MHESVNKLGYHLWFQNRAHKSKKREPSLTILPISGDQKPSHPSCQQRCSHSCRILGWRNPSDLPAWNRDSSAITLADDRPSSAWTVPSHGQLSPQHAGLPWSDSLDYLKGFLVMTQNLPSWRHPPFSFILFSQFNEECGLQSLLDLSLNTGSTTHLATQLWTSGETSPKLNAIFL